MKFARPIFVFLALLAAVFILGTVLQVRMLTLAGRSQSSEGVMKKLLGESRRLFANHFYVKADVSFHSGYYPSIFDQARQAEERENAMAHGGEHEKSGGEGGHEEDTGHLGTAADWIDRFGRNFRVTEHTHLEGIQARELLPWLRISAELDPKRVETYVVAAYWLRRNLGKSDEAEQFLRQGLRANPNSYEILFELGRIFYEGHNDAVRARNLWETAIRRWHQQEDGKKEPDYKALHDIATDLARLEEEQKNYAKAIEWLEVAKPLSPNAESLQGQIQALHERLNTGSQPPH